MFRKYIVFILFLFAFGCANDNQEIKKLDFAKAVGEAQTLKMSKYFSSIEYIPLQTNEESLLGNVLLFFFFFGQYSFASLGDVFRCFILFGVFFGLLCI